MADTYSDTTRITTSLPLGAKVPNIQTSSPVMEQAATGMLEETRRLGEALPAKQAAVQGARAELGKELDKPLPSAPQLRDIPQYQPREISKDDMLSFMGLASALAALGTKAMRGNATMAMNAAASAMKGFQEGNIQQTKLDVENFNTQMKGVIQENRKMTDQYKEIIEDRKLSLAQKQQKLTVAAAERDDEITLSAIRTGNLKTIFDLEAHRISAANQVEMRLGQMNMQYEMHMERMETQKELARLRAQTSEHGRASGMTKDAIDNAAAYFILNGRMPVGMARIGQSAIEAIQNRAAEMTKAVGMSPEQMAAAGPVTKQKLGALMALEKQRNAIQSFEGMLDLNIDILKDLSKKVQRTDSPYANRPILWLQQNAAGDPDVSEYLFQVNTVSTEIARILNNPNMTGQLTDSARQELEGVVTGNLNPEQLDRVLSRAQGDARNRSKMLDKQVDKVISEVRDPLHKSGGPGAAAPRQFSSEAEASAAGLKPGDRVIINGVPGTWH